MSWWRTILNLGEQRTAGEFGDSSIPSWSSVSVSGSGALVTHDSAMALSTVAAAIRQPAVLTAGLPFDVYDVSPDRKERTLSRGKWQNRLLDKPDDMCSGFDFWSDLSSHVDGYGNAVALKFFKRGRVDEMVLLDPSRITLDVDRRTRERTYLYARPDQQRVELPASQVLHVRGWDDSGRPWARSPVARHKDAIGKASARTKMEEKFLANDARPGVIIKLPQNVRREQAEELLDLWDARHRGNPGKTNVIGGGGEIVTLPVSFRDAQFVESEAFGVTETARIFDWPADLLERETERPIVEILTWAVRIHLMPRLRRIEEALGDDQDLFGVGSKFRPYFDVAELLRGDVATMAEVFHKLRQVGIITANEGRRPLGFPPVEGGDELIATPVGGAPNSAPPSPQGGAEAEEPSEPSEPE